MRKVTNQIAKAFFNSQSKAIGNTKTDGQSVWLHGNKIAEKTADGLKLTLAGWNTVTTRERLNGILQVFNLEGGYNQKAYEPYFNGQMINANEWQTVSHPNQLNPNLKAFIDSL